MKSRLLLLSLCCYIQVTAFSQSDNRVIDSLLVVLEASKEDTSRISTLISTLNDISWEFGKVKDFEKAREYADRALSLSQRTGYQQGVSQSYSMQGIISMDMKKYDEALKFLSKALAISEEINDFARQAVNHKHIGALVVNSLGNPPEAIPYHTAAINYFSQTADQEQLAKFYSNRGVAYSRLKKIPESQQDHFMALKLRQEIGDKRGMGLSHSNIGVNFANTFKYEEAIEHHLAAIQFRTEIKDTSNLALSYYHLGKAYYYAGNPDEAIPNQLISLKLRETIGQKKLTAINLRELGLLHDNKAMYDESRHYTTLALQVFEEFNDSLGIPGCYVNLGETYSAQGNFEEAVKCFKQASISGEKVGDKKATAMGLGNTGGIYMKQGNYAEALETILEALKLYTEINEIRSVAVCHSNIGILYKYFEYDSLALENYLLALKLYNETGYKTGIAEVYNNLAGLHVSHKEYTEAISYITKALEIWKEMGNRQGIASSYLSLGRFEFAIDNDTLAREYVQTALEIFKDLEDVQGIAGAYISVGELLLKEAGLEGCIDPKAKYLEALSAYQSAYTLAEKSGETENLNNAYKGLVKAYKGLEYFQQALYYQQLYTSYNDSLLNNETTRQLEQLRTQYEVEKAVTAEKATQDLLLSAQRFQSEKELAERNAQHQLELAEEAARKEKAIEIEKLKYGFALAEEKARQDLLLSEQKFQSEKKLADETAKHGIALAEEKANQERKEAEAKAKAEAEQADRKRRSEIILTIAGLIGIISLFIILLLRQRNLKRRAVEKAESAHKMAELELQSLRAQLNPHFMFNSLNAIQELILMEENDKSHTYLARFAKLLRMLLENANSPFIPLSKELEFLELYLSLENLRIPDLKYKIDVDPGIDTAHTRIPNMILQPYIENAIWHGLSHKKDGDRAIHISVHRAVDGIRYEIEDNGVGRKRAAELKSAYRKEHKSKGMELLTKRFRLLSEEYRSHIETQITDLEQNDMAAGTRVIITVPWELAKEIKKTA